MSDTTPQLLDQHLRAMRIILIALVIGVAIFAAIAFFATAGDPPADKPMLALVAAVFALGAIVGRSVTAAAMLASGRRRIVRNIWTPDEAASSRATPTTPTDADRLLFLYQARLIMQSAIPEGAAFFNVVAFMVEKQLWTLGIVLGLVVWILSAFPTRAGVSTWIQQQLELVELERNQAS